MLNCSWTTIHHPAVWGRCDNWKPWCPSCPGHRVWAPFRPRALNTPCTLPEPSSASAALPGMCLPCPAALQVPLWSLHSTFPPSEAMWLRKRLLSTNVFRIQAVHRITKSKSSSCCQQTGKGILVCFCPPLQVYAGVILHAMSSNWSGTGRTQMLDGM